MRFLVLPYIFKLLHHVLKRFFKDSSVKENKQQQQKTIWADLNSFDFGSTSPFLRTLFAWSEHIPELMPEQVSFRINWV